MKQFKMHFHIKRRNEIMRNFFGLLLIGLSGVSCNLDRVDTAPLVKTIEPKTFSISLKNDVAEYVFENSDGNYVIVGGSFTEPFSIGDGNAIILTIDQEGSSISPTRYDLGSGISTKFTYLGYGIEMPLTKQYMVVGRKINAVTNKNDLFFDRIDASGNEITGFPKLIPSPNNLHTAGGTIFSSENELTIIGSEFNMTNNCDAGMFISRYNLSGGQVQGSWKSVFSGTGRDFQKAIKDTNNNYYYILGEKNECPPSQDSDLFFTKITETGEVLLPPIDFGGSGRDEARSFYRTDNGEFVFLGATTSKGAGSYDIWVFMTDDQGATIGVDTTYGGAYSDNPFAFEKTSDGGCIIAAYTNDPASGFGGDDIVLYKLDKNLKYQWHKYYGTGKDDQSRCVKQTSDGGFIVGGYTSNGSNGFDLYVFKTDQNGGF